VHIEQLYTFGKLGRDPRGRMITVAYFALVPKPLAVHAGTDTTDAQWKSVYDLPKMAFDHADIVGYALKRLRYKLEYSIVGFQLLPPQFTLSELQHAYEIILHEYLDKRNFRRRILQTEVIEETREMRTDGGGRFGSEEAPVVSMTGNFQTPRVSKILQVLARSLHIF
jgi:8-oxo-dGTP diphosphatase